MKKIISAALIVSMCIASLSGCSKKTETVESLTHKSLSTCQALAEKIVGKADTSYNKFSIEGNISKDVIPMLSGSKLKVDIVKADEGKNSSVNMSLSVQGQKLASANCFKRDKDLFVEIPELSDSYLKLNQDEIINNIEKSVKSNKLAGDTKNTSEITLDSLTKNSILSDKKTYKYIEEILSATDKHEISKNTKVSAGDLSAKYT